MLFSNINKWLETVSANLYNSTLTIRESPGDEDTTLPASTNSHGANHARIDDNHVPAPATAEKAPQETSHKKEKSVLQAKLTKLAIQVNISI